MNRFKINIVLIIALMLISCGKEVKNIGGVKQMRFIETTDLSLKFADKDNKIYTFLPYFKDSIMLRIMSESQYHSNKKLINKNFLVSYYFDTDKTRIISGEEDSIFIIRKLELIDSVEDYNKYDIEDYILPPNCTDEKVLNSVEVKFYNTIAKEGEKWNSFYDFFTIEESNVSFTCECELKLKSTERVYQLEYTVKKDQMGRIEIINLQYE